MITTHAEIANRLAANLPAGVFAHAARDATQHQDFGLLHKMLPGVEFATEKYGIDEWHLKATCADGSMCVWRVGG